MNEQEIFDTAMNNELINNLFHAIAIVEDTPQELLNLDTFTREASCGTLHCTAGWLGLDPYFRERGIKTEDIEVDLAANVLERVFGEGAYNLLFSPAGCGDWDFEITHQLLDGRISQADFNDAMFGERYLYSRGVHLIRKMPHKALALARLRKALVRAQESC